MGVMLCEQETTINMYRDSDIAEIYTSDSTVMTRLDKLAESNDSPEWKCIQIINDQDGNLVAKKYQTNKKLVSYRAAIIEREYTEEQLVEMRARMAKMHEARKNKVEEYGETE